MASSTPPDTVAPAEESTIKDSIPKLTLYWLDSSRAHRIVWLLEELELPYELRIYSRRPNLFAPKELKEIHPLGKSPVLSVSRPNSSDKPMVIAESGAIVEYLLDHFGSKLVPQRYPDGAEGQPGAETEEWMRYRYYLHYSEGSLMPLMIVTLLLMQLKSPAIPFLIRPISRGIADRIDNAFLKPNFKTHFSFLEQQLSSSPNSGKFIAGANLTGADIMMQYPLQAGRERVGLDQYPKLIEYIDLLRERDAYKRAIKKTEEVTGKPFTLKL